ncbi:hypothetical protein B0H14DRAFT_3167544, partial [Mycena olivaceomarginata]
MHLAATAVFVWLSTPGAGPSTLVTSAPPQVSSLFSIPTQPRRDNASHGALWNGYDTIGCVRRNAAGLAVHTLPSLYIVLPERTRRLRRSIRRMTVSAQHAQHTDVHGRPFATPYRTRPRRTPAARPPLSSRSCSLTIALTDGILDVAHRGRNATAHPSDSPDRRLSLHAFSPTTRRPRATEIAAWRPYPAVRESPSHPSMFRPAHRTRLLVTETSPHSGIATSQLEA